MHFRASSEGSETKGDSRVSFTQQHCLAVVSNTLSERQKNAFDIKATYQISFSHKRFLFVSQPPSPSMVDSLFRFAVPLLKSDCFDIREAVIVGLGRTSPCSYRYETLNMVLLIL